MTKKAHKYNVDFLFDNPELNEWKEILRWEQENHFTGKRSRIWSQNDREVYFYYLIEKQQHTFIAEIPVTEQFYQEMKVTQQGEQLLHYAARHANNDDCINALRPFVNHLFKHAPALFYATNNQHLTPMKIAIQNNNLPFVTMIKHLLCDKDADLASLTPDFMAHFFKNLYTWAKSVTKNQAILSQLYTMGAICYADYDEKEITNDFVLLFPELNPSQAPYSSPELFLKAALENNEGSSSQSTTNLLAASKQYWTLLLESVILSHNHSSYHAKKMQTLLSALEGTDPEQAPSDEYYDLIDTLIFLIQAEETLAKSEQRWSYFKGLNPIRILFHLDDFFKIDISAETLVNTALCSALFFYISMVTYLSLLKNEAHHEWKLNQRALRDNYTECGDVACSDHKDDWNCCHGTNISDWCDQWAIDFQACSNKYSNFSHASTDVELYGALGFFGTLLALPIILIFLGSCLSAIPQSINHYQFTSSNKDTMHQQLKALLEMLKIHCPLLLENSPFSTRLNLLNKEPRYLTQKEFIEASQAMSQFLASYHSQAIFLPPNLRISDHNLRDTINNFPSKKLVAPVSAEATKKPARFSVPPNDIDIETAPANAPLLARPAPKSRFCVIL